MWGDSGGQLKPPLPCLWPHPKSWPSSPPLGNWRHSPTSARSQAAPTLSGRSENNCYLYGVFNGYDGNRVTSFVAQRLSAELLLGQLSAEHTEADVRRVLLQVVMLGLADRVPRELSLTAAKCWVRQGWSEDAASSFCGGTCSGWLPRGRA